MERAESHKSYRPLTVLTFRFNSAFVGIQPYFFHFTNIVLHAGVCALFHALLERIFSSKYTAFVASLLFVAHPIHAEAVANIVGRAELLAGLFCLLGMHVFLAVGGSSRYGFLFLFL
jgi:hypothetical protein